MDPEITEIQTAQKSDVTWQFDTGSSSPQESFGKFVNSLSMAGDPNLTTGIISLAAQVFNEEHKSEPQSNIELLYHFTDNSGAEKITQTGLLGRNDQEKIYLTKVDPDKAIPLMSTDDARDFEAFIKGEKMPQNLKDHIRKFVLDLKFKWRHGVLRRLGNMVPVGEDKLDNVLVLTTSKAIEEKLIKKDRHGEFYIENQANLADHSNFKIFGPFPTRDKI